MVTRKRTEVEAVANHKLEAELAQLKQVLAAMKQQMVVMSEENKRLKDEIHKHQAGKRKQSEDTTNTMESETINMEELNDTPQLKHKTVEITEDNGSKPKKTKPASIRKQRLEELEPRLEKKKSA